MRKSIWNHRIPTFVALAIVVGGIFVTSFLVSRGVITVGRASQGTTPQDVVVTNNTDTSFTVSYYTQQPTIGSVVYGTPNAVNKTQNEESIGQTKESYSHRITITKLSPSTSYEFYISSNGTTYKNQDNVNYTGITGGELENTNTSNTVKGIVLRADGSASTDTLVLLSTEGSQLLSTKTNTQGDYLFDLGTLRSDSLDDFFVPTSTTEYSLSVSRGGASANASFILIDDATIPTITLTNEYDFTALEEIVDTATTASELEFEQNSSSSLSITNPAANARLTDSRPEFQGTAIAGKVVQLTVSTIPPINATATANANGIWRFRPSTPIPPGNYTVSVETTDDLGSQTTTNRSFVIYSSGTQVDESATPSATITPTTAQPTPTPTRAQPTATPSVKISPTNTTLTVTPTVIIAPQITSIPPTITSAIKEPAATGDSSSTIALTFAAVFSIITGSVIFFIL